MGDFYQNGVITTLHNFRSASLDQLESELKSYSTSRPIAIVIPALYEEFKSHALKNILKELEATNYLTKVVLGLDEATEKDFIAAKKVLRKYDLPGTILWNESPRMKDFRKLLSRHNLSYGAKGKGRNVWTCFGYILADEQCEVVALHDADILTFHREMLARLLFPVVAPHFNFNFSKGFYFRATDDALNGRVCRLFFTPLLRALLNFHEIPFLRYMDSFRYPLAGEMAMRLDFLRSVRLPSDWGLEVGFLAEANRITSYNRICQVEIADRYDHKHQVISYEKQTTGLSKMTLEISRAIFVKLAAEGVIFSRAGFNSIRSTFLRIALDFIDRYDADARLNGLKFDRHREENMVRLFADNIYYSGIHYTEKPLDLYSNSSWKQTISAIPDVLSILKNIVKKDNQEYE